jgi:nucleotide-binding universal stress UspA family protein
MQLFRSTSILGRFPSQPVSARTLRLWTAPDLILAVTSLTDEAILLPHIISQARHSSARVILAHVHDPEAVRNCRKMASAGSRVRAREAREELERMARQLRWIGITCEPILLSGRPEMEIPLLIHSCGVERVLFRFEETPAPAEAPSSFLHERLLRNIDIPVCAIGRNVIHSNTNLIRNVTLAVSSKSDCDVPLSFACRLAQEHRAKLTVLHVSDRNGSGPSTPDAVAAKLPFTGWREAELFCPTEITVAEGDPAERILSHSTSTQQDLIVMCSPGDTSSAELWHQGVTYRTIAGARCPVLVVQNNSQAAVDTTAGSTASEKFAPEGEGMKAKPRKEAVM